MSEEAKVDLNPGSVAEGLRALASERISEKKQTPPISIPPTSPTEPISSKEEAAPLSDSPKGDGSVGSFVPDPDKGQTPPTEAKDSGFAEYEGKDPKKRNDWNQLTQTAKQAKEEAEVARSRATELETQLSQIQESLKTAEEKLKAYSGLEGAVVLENSPEFQQAFIEKKKATHQKAKQIAEMNEVDASVVDEAFSKASYREAVILLNDYVADVSAFNDLKAQAQEYFLIETEMKKALQSPEDYRDIIKTKVEAEKAERAKQEKALASTRINEAWKSLEPLRTDDNADLLSKAKQDVTTLIAGLIDSGVEVDAEAIETFSKVWTRAYLYGQQGKVIEDLKSEVEELRGRLSLDNPRIDNSSPTSAPPQNKKFDRESHFSGFISKFVG